MQLLMFMGLLSGPISLKMNEHSGSGHAKGASISALSSNSQAQADRFTQHLLLRNACTT